MIKAMLHLHYYKVSFRDTKEVFLKGWQCDSKIKNYKKQDWERVQGGIAFIHCVVAWQMLAWASKALWQPPAESTLSLMCLGMPAS